MSISLRVNDEWVPVPLPDRVKGEAFHYTNAQGLLGIVERSELWASSPLALNDMSEVTYGTEVVLEACAARSDSAATKLSEIAESRLFLELRANVYFVSASEQADSLTQWIGYAGNQGYALGIDLDSGLEVAPSGSTPTVQVRLPASFMAAGWYRVIYSRDEQLAAVRALLDFCSSQPPEAQARHLVSFFCMLLPQMKHPAFSDEREVRFITSLPVGGTESFRCGRRGMVPYVKLARRSDKPSEAKLPLTKVVVGPTNADEQPLVVDSVRRLLDVHGYQSTKVTASFVPFRF